MSAVQNETFTSLDELLFKITHLTKDWDAVWFRGCSSDKHTLLPKILRSNNYNEIIASIEFRRRMKSDFPIISEDIDWLVAMQHFGLPTRLLDWSESLIVALYFACLPLTKNKNPTIWVINPFLLSKLATKSEVIPTSDNEDIINISQHIFNEIKLKNEKPIPFIPNYIFSRLKAQDSCFTVHGSSKDPLEKQISNSEIDTPALLKFVCTEAGTPNILLGVNLLCSSHMLFFPDVDGFSRWLGPED